MDYKDQSARDLWFHASHSFDSLDQLSVLDSATIQHASLPLEAKFAIIGESHFVRLNLTTDSAPTKLSEILLCIPLDVPGGQSLQNTALHRHQETVGSLLYNVAINRTPCQPQLIEEFRKPTEGVTLLDVLFPDKSEGIPPTTSIRFHQTPQGLQWETLHVYPEENEMVWSSSSLLNLSA
jgi:hypothetical protein